MTAEEAAVAVTDNEVKHGIPEQWSRDRLMGKSVSFKGLSEPPEEGENGTSSSPTSDKPRRRRSSKKIEKGDVKLDPMLWGQPGHLTEEEADIYVSTPDGMQQTGNWITMEGLSLSCAWFGVDDLIPTPRIMEAPSIASHRDLSGLLGRWA